MNIFTQKEIQQMFADVALAFIFSEETDPANAGVLGEVMGEVIKEAMGEEGKAEYLQIVGLATIKKLVAE